MSKAVKEVKEVTTPRSPPSLLDAAGFVSMIWDLLPSVVAAKNVSSRNEAAAAEGVEGAGATPPEGGGDTAPAAESTTEAAGGAGDINQIASTEDVVAWLQSMHRASFNNITEDESAAEVAKHMTAPTNEDSGFQKSWAVDFMSNVVLKEWLRRDPTAATKEENSVIWNEYARCILSDASEAPELLKLAEVLIHKMSTRVETDIKNYIPLVQYKGKDRICFDAMWLKLSGGKDSIDEETFAHWFNWLYFAVFDNATARRANMAAKTHYYEEIAATGGQLKEEAFRNAARRLHRAYCQQELLMHNAAATSDECVGFYEDLMEQSMKLASGDDASKDRDDNNSEFFQSTRPKSKFGQGTLECPVKFHVVDNLDAAESELAFFGTPTKNRILVVGRPGLGKTTFGRKLAATLGAVHIDVYELALKAVRDAKSGFHARICAAVETGAFPNELQWELVKAALEDPATQHRGYVLSDVPNCMLSTKETVLGAFFEFLAPMADPPQVVVEITCPNAAYEKWGQRALTVQNSLISAEHQLRADEAAHAAAQVAAVEAKAEKLRRREERAARKEKIAAGEIEATPEDEAEDEPEEEANEEEEAPVDDEGNPLDEAQVAALKIAKEAKVTQRKLEADLYEQYIQAGRLDPELEHFNPIESPAIEQFMEVSRPNDCVIEIPCYDTTLDQVKYVTEKLRLAQRTIPTLPDVPTEELEGIDLGTPEGEQGMLDANQRTIEANTNLSMSVWQRYCPVTYKQDNILFEGSWLFSCVYRNRYYTLASRSKLNQFMANPHPFLLNKVKSYTPAALLQESLSTLEGVVDIELLKRTLGEELGLSPLALGDFAIDWKQHADEVSRRSGIQSSRQKQDAATLKERADRTKKIKADEAKKKKAGEKGKKKGKKTEEIVEEEVVAQDAGGEAHEGEKEGGETAPPTIEDVLTAQLEKQKLRRQGVLPLLVDCSLNLREAPLNQVFDQRVLPEMVLLLQCKAPKVEGEDEEEEAVEEDAADDDAAAGEPELDEDGNEKPKPPPAPMDLGDSKQYAKFVRKTVARMAKSAEEAAAIAEAGEAPAGEDGEAKAELPPQNFTVKTVNLYGLDLKDIVKTIIQLINPVAQLALPPSNGEDLEVDEPLENEDEENPTNPLLIPGRRAVHQYGRTLKYCPWTLREQGTLLQGNTQFWCAYQGQRYTFVSQVAMDMFTQNPERYMPTVPPSIPAPRVFILGVPSAGKRTLAKSFSDAYSIPTFPYNKDAFQSIMVAGMSAEGATIEGGVKIPSQPTNKSLLAAIVIRTELEEFAAKQVAQIALKDQTTKQQEEREALREEGEEVDELDEDEEAEIAKILEFEPEEEEAKAEREGLAERKMAAHLMRVEPFESCGYVLVEHPANETEFNQLIDAGAIPEIVIRMKLSSELFVSRRVDAEAAKRDAEYKTALREVVAKKAEIMRKTREQELLRWRRRNIGQDDDPLEELDEMPEDPEEVPLDQTKADLEASYDTFSSDVDAVMALFPEKFIPVIEINGDSGVETVVSSTFDMLAPNLSRRRSLLEAPQIVSFKEATSRLLTGSHVLSSFGFQDPVALLETREGAPPKLVRCPDGENIAMEAALPVIPPPEPKKKEFKKVPRLDAETGEEVLDADGNAIEDEVEVEAEEEEEAAPEEVDEVELEAEPELAPEELDEMKLEFDAKVNKMKDAKAPRAVILRNRIYFLKDEVNLLKFMQNPLQYWDQAPPLDRVDSTVIAVMQDQPDEEAADTKSPLPRNLAHHLAKNLNFQYVDIPKLVKWVLKRRAVLPHLYAHAKAVLFTDDVLSNDFIAAALSARLHAVDIKSSGAVVHNLPRNWKQFMTLTSNSILLNHVYVVDNFTEEDVKVLPMIDGVARVVTKVKEPDTTECLMECYSQAVTNVDRRQTLNLRRKFGFPARIDGASVPEAQIEGSLSVFQWYCPYMWSHENQLVDIRDERLHVAEYCGEVYCFSTARSLADFMINPERFSGEVSKLQELPTMLPSHIDSGNVKKEQLEFCGCCPVTLYETRNHRGLKGITEPTAVLGSGELTVEYDQKYYSLVDERAMTLFLRQPWVYTKGATLPMAHKLPFDNEKWKTLSAEHFITKALYEQVAGALLEVAQTRPKFPGLSIEDSARKFVALHLRAHNTNNTEHRQECYQANFKSFEERATLYKTITTVAPEDPNELVKFEHRCKVWDDVQDDQECYKAYAELK